MLRLFGLNRKKAKKPTRKKKKASPPPRPAIPHKPQAMHRHSSASSALHAASGPYGHASGPRGAPAGSCACEPWAIAPGCGCNPILEERARILRPHHRNRFDNGHEKNPPVVILLSIESAALHSPRPDSHSAY